MKKSVILFCVILFCQSCSLFKAKTIPYPTGVIFPVEKDKEQTYEGEIISPIQREGQLLYFSTRKGRVYCVDGPKREILWHTDISSSLSSSPYLAENRIYVSDGEKTLFSLDRDGKLLSKMTFLSEITSGIAVNEGQIYAATEKGLLISLDEKTGQLLWQFKADDSIRSNLVLWQNKVLFGCDDHAIYSVDNRGRFAGKLSVGGKTAKSLTVDGDLLFFGTDDHYLHCVNLKRLKSKWKIRSGGATFVPPVVSGKRIFFLCWNCVLYCLKKNSGTMIWWNSVPSRSYYRVEVIEKKVVASSLSPKLVCFDIQTGENKGSFDATQEIKSNPAWLAPYLLVNLHDPEKDIGKLVFLKKAVGVILSSSRKSPRRPDEDITFTAKATGFHLPKYEFYLTRFITAKFYPDIFLLYQQGERQMVQESSDTETWQWFPDEEGYYSVDVVVVDEKEMAQAKVPFLIRKRAVGLSLTSSVESPQNVDQEVVFAAKYSGFVSPRFEFRLSRLKWVSVLGKFSLLLAEEEKVIQDTSEKDSWEWSPKNRGLYLIRVIARDEQESATAHLPFVIKKE